MTDIAVPANDEGASADMPAPVTEEQINDIIRQGVQEAFDSRIPGLMSVQDKKVAQLERQLETLRKSALPEDELEAEEDAKTQAELAEARRRVAALEAARKYPKGFDIYEQIMQQESAEDQIALLERLGGAGQTQESQAPAPSDQTEEPEGTPPIDPNNPRREETAIGGIQNEEQAFAILDQYSAWPTPD